MNSIKIFEMKLSRWSYKYCKNTEDDPMVRQYINHPMDAYLYCKNIKYNEELAKIANKGGLDV